MDTSSDYSTSIIWSCVLKWGKDGLRRYEELLRERGAGRGIYHEGEDDADEVAIVLGWFGIEEWRTCNGNSEGENACIDKVLLFNEAGRRGKAPDDENSLLLVDKATGGTAVLWRGRENSIGNYLETLGNSLRQGICLENIGNSLRLDAI